MIEKQVFCRFVEEYISLKSMNDGGKWMCQAEDCQYCDKEYKDGEVMIAPFPLKEPEIEKKTETKDIVIICRYLMPFRGNA